MSRFFGIGMKALLTGRAGRGMLGGRRDWLLTIALAFTAMAAVFAYALFARV